MKIFLAGLSDKPYVNHSNCKYFLESFVYYKDWEKVLLKNKNKNDIQLFFELDIDAILGIKEVERLRRLLERMTNKKCIPVWHKSRGKDYFIKMCKEYNYVAIGGIVTKEISIKEYKYFNWFIKEAHKNNCSIHGLGFTNTNLLSKYKFDTVDSTSWKSGGRFAQVHTFKNNKIEMKGKSKQLRLKDYKSLDQYNFNEWCKYQKYMEGR